MQNDKILVDLVVRLLPAVDLERKYSRVRVVFVAHRPVDPHRFAGVNRILDGQMFDGTVKPEIFGHHIISPYEITFFGVVDRFAQFPLFNKRLTVLLQSPMRKHKGSPTQ